jgi:galactose oxidase
VITSVPAKIFYGQSFTVETPGADAITRGTLIRLSLVTHTFNQSQLIFPFTFTSAGPTSIKAMAPGNANLAPPGPYMLFLINGSGVPSVAKIVTVGP